MSNMKGKLEKVIELGFAPTKLFLEESKNSGNVAGYIVSDAFRGLDQPTRQEMLWNFIESKMTKQEADSIILLVTLAPSEVEDQPLDKPSPRL